MRNTTRIEAIVRRPWLNTILCCLLLCGGVAADDGSSVKMDESALGLRSLMLMGRARGAQKQWPEALSLFQRAAAKEPEDEEVRFSLATALVELDRAKEAHAILKGMIDGGTTSPVVLNNAAWAMLKITDPAIRDVPLALSYARQAVLQLPNDAHVWGTLAEAHYAMQDHEDSSRAARIALTTARIARLRDIGDFVAMVQRCESAAMKSSDNE